MSNQYQEQISLPPPVRSLLRQVRYRLRRDATITGLLLAACFAGAVFWFTTTIDLGWFQLQRLELPVGLRAILLALFFTAASWLLVSRIAVPLVRKIGDHDLAILLECYFPQFQDRLITAVQSAQGLPADGPLVRAMLERAGKEAESLAGSVKASDIFDSGALRRLSIYAGGLLLSVAAAGLYQPQLLVRWWSAFIRCDETYHERTTDLRVVAVSQPGDRRVEFSNQQGQPLYRHPRGNDLELEMTIPEGGPSPERSWIVPDRIRVEVVRSDRSRSRTYVTATASSKRTFRFVITRLQESVVVDLLAGDFRTRAPYRIEVVSVPGLDTVRLECRYPEYTGWNQLQERTLTVTGSEIQLPIGTVFELRARASKRLQGARIISDQFELSGDRDRSSLRFRDGQTVATNGPPLISDDGKTIAGWFEIRHSPDESPRDATDNPDSSKDVPVIANGKWLLPIPSSTGLRFSLHDEDDVLYASPANLRVQGIIDQPPVVIAQMTNIDNAITRLARIPVAGRIRDDYGLKSANFEFLVDDETGWRSRTFRSTPATGITEFALRRSDDEKFELFDVRPLELSEGQTLTLSVVASDANPSPAPGLTRSDPLLFRIVSIEELLSLLYTREVALRARFEEVIAQLEAIQTDLQFHEEVARRVDATGSSAVSEDQISLNTCATRSGNSLRRQTNELNSIVEGFEEIVGQLINNSVPPQQQAERMRADIVAPLQAVSGEMINSADRAIGAFRVAAQELQPVEALTFESSRQVSQIITTLKQILENVRDMAEFHEALRDLKAILDEQQKNLEQTRKLQKSRLIDDILK